MNEKAAHEPTNNEIILCTQEERDRYYNGLYLSTFLASLSAEAISRAPHPAMALLATGTGLFSIWGLNHFRSALDDCDHRKDEEVKFLKDQLGVHERGHGLPNNARSNGEPTPLPRRR